MSPHEFKLVGPMKKTEVNKKTMSLLKDMFACNIPYMNHRIYNEKYFIYFLIKNSFNVC